MEWECYFQSSVLIGGRGVYYLFSNRITNCKLLHPYCFKRYVYKWVEGVPAFTFWASDKSHAEKGNNYLQAKCLDLINFNIWESI